MVRVQHDDSERQALILLRDQLAAEPPRGVVPRIRRWGELRTANWMLDYEDARRDGSDVLASERRWMAIGIPVMFGAVALQALFFSTRALTIGRAAGVLALAAGMAAGILLLASRLYRRQARQVERAYQRWLERARALPPLGDDKRLGQSNAAV
jgi:hypothetical protein